MVYLILCMLTLTVTYVKAFNERILSYYYFEDLLVFLYKILIHAIFAHSVTKMFTKHLSL